MTRITTIYCEYKLQSQKNHTTVLKFKKKILKNDLKKTEKNNL